MVSAKLSWVSPNEQSNHKSLKQTMDKTWQDKITYIIKVDVIVPKQNKRNCHPMSDCWICGAFLGLCVPQVTGYKTVEHGAHQVGLLWLSQVVTSPGGGKFHKAWPAMSRPEADRLWRGTRPCVTHPLPLVFRMAPKWSDGSVMGQHRGWGGGTRSTVTRYDIALPQVLSVAAMALAKTAEAGTGLLLHPVFY